jgi:2-oxoglutarate ferredoxin oxidoreductase subunit gamma
MAQELGNDSLGNMVIIGAFVEKTQVVSLDTLIAALPKIFEERYHPLLPANVEAIHQGARFARAYRAPSKGNQKAAKE